MSLWGFDGEDSSMTPALTSWPSLSQFDDMVWNEFGEAAHGGDHIVSDSQQKRAHRERSVSGSSAKGEVAAKSAGSGGGDADMSDEEGSNEVLAATPCLAAAFADGGWDPLGGVAVDELPVESELFAGSDRPPPVSQETFEGDNDDEEAVTETGRRSRNAGGKGAGGGGGGGGGAGRLYPGTGNSSAMAAAAGAPFSMSHGGGDEDGLGMFGGDESSVELAAWENIGALDDMDKLFRNADTPPFEPAVVMGSKGTEGLNWQPPSSLPANERGMPFARPSDPAAARGGEPISVHLEAHAEEEADAKELAFGSSLPTLVMRGLDGAGADGGSPRSLSVSAGAPVPHPSLPPADQREMSFEAKPSVQAVKVETKGGTSTSGSSLPDSENANMSQANRARRQAANRKRSEDRFKRTTAYRKLSPGPGPFNGDPRQLLPRPRRLPGQPPHLQASSAFPLQCLPPNMPPGSMTAPQYPPILPYVSGGRYPRPFVPAISSCPSPSPPMMHTQHPQPMYVDLPQPGSQVHRQPVRVHQPSPLASNVPFDSGSRPPTGSPTMTPQEKQEKLRWRQQMQARRAVEQQQQRLLAPQSGEEMGTAMYHNQPPPAMCQGPLPNQPVTPSSGQLVNAQMEAEPTLVVPKREVVTASDGPEEGDGSLEGSVLCQLKSTVSSLDLGTRLCIRDALFRLARSAMKRRAAGSDNLTSQGSQEQDSDANAVESSTASGPQSSRHSRATSVSMMETETNPIDRTIANLLFSQPPPQMYGLQPSFCT